MNFLKLVLGAPFRAGMALVAWVHAAFCALLDPEGRRAWAVILCFGCGVVMTGYAYWGLYIESQLKNSNDVFWLATEAFGILLVVISAITGLLVKRDIGGSVKGPGNIEANVNITDTGGGPDHDVAA